MLDIIFRWKCDLCDNTHVESQGDFTDTTEGIGAHLGYAAHIDCRHMPRGWSILRGGQMVCPLHSITVQPLSLKKRLELAKEIYDGVYGDLQPIPLPDSLTPQQFKEKQ